MWAAWFGGGAPQAAQRRVRTKAKKALSSTRGWRWRNSSIIGRRHIGVYIAEHCAPSCD
jgi:CRISPR/Cas system-associated exonuclease Cas4 (RecB family)